jgi:hypothetical protein
MWYVQALSVLAFCHFCRLTFEGSKSWVPLKLEKPKARLEVLLASGFWIAQKPTRKSDEKLKQTGLSCFLFAFFRCTNNCSVHTCLVPP